MSRPFDHGFTALSVQGGLLPPEFLRTVASLEAGQQDNASYGLTRSLAIREEIGRNFRIAADLWADFRARRGSSGAELRRAAVDGWLVPFLTQVLGFKGVEPSSVPLSLGGRSFPLTHRAHGGAVPLVLVPPGFDLDRADPLFGEEGRRRTPMGLLQEYLNAAEDAVWGLVANGLTLRILRDNPNFTKPAWIELDLERVFEDQVYPDFAAFWLLAHGSRFQPRTEGQPASCILERWRQAAQATGERAREKLRDGVATALLTLGRGFVRHPANDTLRAKLGDGRLDAMGLHQQLLRLVYRCLFLFVVEDRDLLHPPGTSTAARRLWRQGYGIGQLRERALRSRLHDGYGDLWQSLEIAFQALERGAPEIGAPALGGLFDRGMCPDLFGASLRNRDLLAAIAALAFFRPDRSTGLARVNYRDLDTEELGSVYESLLELHPQVGREPWDFAYLGLDGDAAKGSERKLTGSYYTPSSLVDELVKSTLEPVIRRTMSEHPHDQREALLRLKILDPACGSGHFLLAAARRLAFEIARLDAAPDAPTEAQRQHAMREVVQRCIYGVDRNPLALELCKTALWIETVEPGKPLSFLDHHLRCGDALVGVLDPNVLEAGIPDEAYKPKTGDDRETARTLKAQNKAERERPLLRLSLRQEFVTLADGFEQLAAMAEDLPQEVAAKAEAYTRLLAGEFVSRLRTAADLWTAAFFARIERPRPGQPQRVPTTRDVWEAIRSAGGRQGPRAAEAAALADTYRFFHWPLEFPEVFHQGGFDVVLGNPPWERIKLQEQEFFAARHEAIAGAPNKAAREKLIKGLAISANPVDRKLHAAFETAKAGAEAASQFIRGSGRFPLTAVGDVNTYAVFAELTLRALGPKGRAGIIVPTGIATDNSTKAFFDEVASKGRLASLYDFENRDAIFAGVHRSYKFSLLTLASGVEATRFAFFLSNPLQLADERRRFTLSPADIALINPNTKTCPIFRTGYDAELTKKIYRRVPVLIDEAKGEAGNPWGISFLRMFDMANDSGLFRNHAQLAAAGGRLADMVWTLPDGSRWLPLYEAKMIHHYDHRWASYDPEGESDDVGEAQKRDPNFRAMPRYWVEEREVEARLADKGWARGWLMGWRDICRSTDERTVIASVIPRVAVNHKAPLFFTDAGDRKAAALYGSLCSLPLDFVARQKVGGTSLTFFILKQLPILPPNSYAPADLDFIVPRVLELTYTAWDLQPFARDLGYDGPPFRWDPARRALLRAELDAYYAWLYGLTKDELRYVLDPQDVMGADWPSETFRVLEEKEFKEHGEYRTRRLVLEAWDRFHADGTFDPARTARAA
ncbi:Eco57I restriction-modification methylase domain-containing protein [Benzoatithermus flavus]|uniref:site-specific DNA-methyltransferase (adenine-specific) n=1 Tax=Benzoatithermus flavus TaxID=3108223 RepID=A0ABU8XPL6_9PROT